MKRKPVFPFGPSGMKYLLLNSLQKGLKMLRAFQLPSSPVGPP
jgi:hypothetical protein